MDALIKLCRRASAAVLFGACGGSVVAAPPTPCGVYAQAYCAKQEACTSSSAITRGWGDMATCVERETIVCTNGLGAPHTGQSVSILGQCTAALPGSSCEGFLAGELPTPCNPLGPGALGTACTFNAQCQSGYCSDIRFGTCGTCAPPPAAGSTCATSTCGHGQSCVVSAMVSNVCEAYASRGATCGAFQDPPCNPVVACAGASTATGAPGTCKPPVSTAGAACGSKNADLNCDGRQGLWCLDEVCIQVTYAGDGMPCGYIGSGVVECTAGTCYSSAGPYFLYSGPSTGVCRAFAADGAACDTVSGPSCMSGARCLAGDGGTSGVCTVPTAAVSASCH